MAFLAEQFAIQEQVHVGPLTPAWADSFLEATVCLSYLKHIALSLALSLCGFLTEFLWAKIPWLSQ